jgi:hypothetical protein
VTEISSPKNLDKDGIHFLPKGQNKNQEKANQLYKKTVGKRL